jgi:hypothetical protein
MGVPGRGTLDATRSTICRFNRNSAIANRFCVACQMPEPKHAEPDAQRFTWRLWLGRTDDAIS